MLPKRFGRGPPLFITQNAIKKSSPVDTTPPTPAPSPINGKIFSAPILFCLFVLFVLCCSIALSLFNLVAIGNNMQEEIRTGNLHHTLNEAHAALRSARHVTDSLPIADVVKHWKNSNELIKKSKIPWGEVPKWREFASRSMDNMKQMIKEHPNWSKDLKETTGNIEKTAHPLAQESKEWRESFKNVAKAYSDTLVNMYKK